MQNLVFARLRISRTMRRLLKAHPANANHVLPHIRNLLRRCRQNRLHTAIIFQRRHCRAPLVQIVPCNTHSANLLSLLRSLIIAEKFANSKPETEILKPSASKGFRTFLFAVYLKIESMQTFPDCLNFSFWNAKMKKIFGHRKGHPTYDGWSECTIGGIC